jgi:replicative DNA helicase
MKAYRNYLDTVSGKSGILLRSKKDFSGHITPSKIEAWIKNQDLDIVFLDGIGYVETERAHSSNKSEASIITDVAEDLMAVSTSTGCPIILTAQANRDGADRSKNPGLEAVRGSDGIGINASFVISIAYPDDTHRVLSLEVLKCRFGTTGMKFNYDWSPDVGYVNSREEITQSGGAFYG